jgi:4'-phosphopantetheinyl transferase
MQIDAEWLPGPTEPKLGADEIHVWLARLDEPWAISELATELDDAELRIAGRFHREQDRDAYVVSHGIRRHLLAQYLKCLPAELRFATSEHGKPRLAMGESADRLKFSMSHSGRRAVFAFAWDCEVGIDVEQTTSRVDVDSLTAQVYSAPELVAVKMLSAKDARDEFFRAWTRKEAVLKAAGVGLSVSPTCVEVLPGEVRSVLVKGQEWWVWDLPKDRGYQGGIAAARSDVKLHRWCKYQHD